MQPQDYVDSDEASHSDLDETAADKAGIQAETLAPPLAHGPPPCDSCFTGAPEQTRGAPGQDRVVASGLAIVGETP